jgi:hypothetical protein
MAQRQMHELDLSSCTCVRQNRRFGRTTNTTSIVIPIGRQEPSFGIDQIVKVVFGAWFDAHIFQ